MYLHLLFRARTPHQHQWSSATTLLILSDRTYTCLTLSFLVRWGIATMWPLATVSVLREVYPEPTTHQDSQVTPAINMRIVKSLCIEGPPKLCILFLISSLAGGLGQSGLPALYFCVDCSALLCFQHPVSCFGPRTPVVSIGGAPNVAIASNTWSYSAFRVTHFPW